MKRNISIRGVLLLSLGALSFAAGCASTRSGVGGESHFSCQVDADCVDVPGDLVCIAQECRPRSERDNDWDAGAGGRGSGGRAKSGGGPSLPDAGTGGAPRFGDGSVATGCAALVSGYEGDEYCLDAPDPEDGFLLHFGPTDYDDPEEVEKYLVPSGEERDDCVFMKAPTDTEVLVGSVRTSARSGMHHLRVLSGTDTVADSPGPESCAPGDDFWPLVLAYRMVTEPATPAPEHAGLATRLPARAQLGIMLHSVNTGGEPLLREAWIVVGTIDPLEVVLLSAAIDWVGGRAMNVPPRASQIIQAGGPACSVTESRDIISLTASTGASTNRLSLYVDRAGDAGAKQLVYENYDWHEPLEVRFDTVTENPAPDAINRTSGGISGPLRVEPGDIVSWECEVRSVSDNPLFYGFGPYTHERCDVFGTFVSTSGAPWICATD